MKHRLEINTIEKIAKILIFIPAIIMLFFLILALYCSFSGKNVSIGGNYSVLGLLINVGVLILIFVSVSEFIRIYQETVKK